MSKKIWFMTPGDRIIDINDCKGFFIQDNRVYCINDDRDSYVLGAFESKEDAKLYLTVIYNHLRENNE
jgi:hypothetical protein